MPDERPRSNPDLVPPHRCSLVCVWNALPKHPLSSRRFQAHRQLALHHKKPLVAATSLRRRDTLVRPLSRNSRSVVSSDAIRHMRVAGMEESAKSGSKESHALRHRFGDPHFALPAPGHLDAPVPRTRTELCRYPFGLLSAVGPDCVDFHSDDKVVRASGTNDPSLTKGKGF